MSTASTYKKRRAQPPKHGNFVITVQDPDPCRDFVKDMLEIMPDLAHLVWGWEVGAETGRSHYQVFAHTFKQHRVDEYYYDEETSRFIFRACKFDFIQGAYAPKRAAAYACKADHTLVDVPGNPYEWKHADYVTNGHRHEMDDVFKEVQAGGDYQSFMREGKHLNVCAKYPAFVMKLTSIQRPIQQKLVVPTWPVTVLGHTIQDPMFGSGVAIPQQASQEQ